MEDTIQKGDYECALAILSPFVNSSVMWGGGETCILSIEIKMLDQNLGTDTDQDQSADQVQFEVYFAAEAVAEVDAKSWEQEGDDSYRQGFQCYGWFDAGQRYADS